MMIKAALIRMPMLSAGVGAFRSSGMTEEEEAALKKHYGLDPNASLGLRNAGRGMAGGFLGYHMGNAVGKTLSGEISRGANLTAKKFPGKGGAALLAANIAAKVLPRLGKMVGAGTGAYMNTSKYTSDNAQKIMARDAEKRMAKMYPQLSYPPSAMPAPQPQYQPMVFPPIR